MKKVKIISIVTIGIAALFISVFFCFHKSYSRYSDEKSDFFVWSTNGCNGVDTILGMRTDNVTGVYRGYQVYPIDSLDNKEFVGLTYPFQVNDTIYYTTTDAETAENCIISKKGNDLKYITSQNDNITYKRVIEDSLYYVMKHGALDSNDICEIHCFNLKNKTDKLIIDDVHATASFDVDENGNILYVNRNNEVVLWNPDNIQKSLGIGTSACFWKDECILIAKDSGLYSFSTDNSFKKICNATGYNIELSLSKTYAALQYNASVKPAVENNCIQIVDLNSGRTEEIKTVPYDIYGFAWLDNCYPC